MHFFRTLDEHIMDENREPPKRHPDSEHEFNSDPDAFIEKYREMKFNNYDMNNEVLDQNTVF